MAVRSGIFVSSHETHSCVEPVGRRMFAACRPVRDGNSTIETYIMA